MKKILFIICSMICLNSWALNKSNNDRFIVAQYFGTWAGSEQLWHLKFRDVTPFTKLNRIYVTGGQIVKTTDGHFTIAFEDTPHTAELLTRVRTDNPQAEIFISVVGSGSMNAYGGAARDSKFADNVLAFLRQNNLNGLDIDWRVTLSKDDLSIMLKNVYEALHPVGYQLTLDVWQFVSPQYDVSVIKNYIDQINIMSYGTGIGLDVCAGDYIRSGFAAKQIIGSVETEVGYKQYGGVTDTLGANGTVRKKATYAMRAGLAGMANWRMDNDYTERLTPEFKGTSELWNVVQGN